MKRIVAADYTLAAMALGLLLIAASFLSHEIFLLIGFVVGYGALVIAFIIMVKRSLSRSLSW